MKMRTPLAELQEQDPVTPHYYNGPSGLLTPLRLGFLITGLLLLSSILLPLCISSSYDTMLPDERLEAPDIQHPFGTDEFGRDMFSRTLIGMRIAYGSSFLSVGISLVVGIALGLIAGYFHGWIDQLFSRSIDLWLSIPGLLLALILIVKFGPSTLTTALALGLTGIPAFFRIVRYETLRLQQMAFIEANISIGSPNPHILLYHILPNVLPSLLPLIALRFGTNILASSGLSFIGLGATPPEPELGALLSGSRFFFDPYWWLAAFPGLAIVSTILGFNLLSDGLRDSLSPHRHRSRLSPPVNSDGAHHSG